MSRTRTIWVFGDQLGRQQGVMATADPATDHILLVESEALVTGRRWHRQRLHLVLTAMRAFAADLTAEGFQVDLRRAPTLAAGLAAHRAAHGPSTVVATEPLSHAARALCARAGVTMARSTQFLCHPEEFAAWAQGRRQLRMEDFYRWQRRRLGYLMDADGEPEGGEWNYDHLNREPPPRTGDWPAPAPLPLGPADTAVISDWDLATDHPHLWGALPTGTWPTTRAAALARLEEFVSTRAPLFGPHEDAMTERSWHLAHSLLSSALNLGLLTPAEVCDAVEAGYRAGRIPLASAEGMIRQVIGWREYVWGVYWLWGPEYRRQNALDARRPLPPAFEGAPTQMACVATAMAGLHDRAYAHHIQRLMILGNLALLAGVDPWEMTTWMWSRFIDGAEWVMLPNVIGMALHADGGRMASKPYAAGGNYIDKMSDHCRGCAFDRKARTGPTACPFTTLYWDFLARHTERFGRNARVAQQVRAAERLADLPAVRARAAEVLVMLDEGRL